MNEVKGCFGEKCPNVFLDENYFEFINQITKLQLLPLL